MAPTYSLRRITDLKPGDHLCSLYETEEAHRALLTPFLRQGLERGEKVLYIVDDHPAETVLGYLRDDGLEVEPYLASGQLSILTASDTYMREGVFDPDGMIALLRAETERALAEGYSALRLTGEMSWALRGLPGSERLIECEARLNEFFPDSKCLALCQYDRRRFDPAVLSDVLCTHPIAVIGTAVYDTFYYIPPAEFLSHDPSAAKLHHWLNHLAERNRAAEELKKYRDHLEEMVEERTAELTTANEQLQREITERQRVEEELKSSEERLKILFEFAPDGYYLSDLKGNFIDGNKAAEDVVGYKKEELIGKSFLKLTLLPPKQIPKAAMLLARNALRQPTGPDEFILNRKDGKQVVVEIRTFPVKIKGQVLVLGIARDIAERKRAEEELRKAYDELELRVQERTAELATANEALRAEIAERKRAEEELAEERNLLRTLIDNLPDLIYVKDTESRYVVSNIAHVCFLGRTTPDEVIGKTVFELFPQELAAQYYADDQEVIRSGQPLLKREERSADQTGKRVWHLTTKVPLRDSEGKIVGLVGIARDITERKRAEEALRDAETKYRTLVEQLPAITYVVELGKVNRTTYISPQVESLLGFSQAEWLADPDLWLRQLHPDDREGVLSEVRRKDASGEPLDLEYRVLTHDGRVLWFRNQTALVRDETGRIRYSHGMMFDITERKRAEEALKRRLEQLTSLNQASQAVTASLELDQVLAEIVSLAGEVAASDYAGVVLVDEEGRLSRSAEYLPDVPDIGGCIRAEGFANWIVRSRQAVVVDDIDEDGTVHPRPADEAPCTVNPPVTKAGVRSFVGLPLVAKERLLGALFLHSLRPGTFRDQLPLLTTFANQAAVAIENAHLYEGVSKRLAQVSSLQTVSTAMVSTLELEKLLELIVEQATNLLGGEGGVLNMCDLDQNTEEVVATAGSAKPEQGVKDSLEDTLSGWVTVHNQPLICNDLAADPRSSRRGIEAMKARTAILAPLGVKEQVIGSLVVLDKEKSRGGFNQDDLDLLVAFANQAAVAIENARLHQEVQHRVGELVFLNRVGRTVTSSLNLEQVLMAILEEAALMLRTEASSILLFDEESSELVFKAAFGRRSEEAKGLRLPLGQSIAGWVAQEGQPLLVPDVREDPRFYSGIDQATGFVTRSVIGVPLEVKGKMIGVIEAVNKTEGDFSQADVELLSSMAQSAAIAIENARLYKDLQNRMEELERTQAQLIQSAKLAAIGELAAGVAHELNNPLTSIMGFTSLLLRRMDDNAPMKEELQIIEQAAARTKTIVRGLLDFARQTESRLELADVNEIVQSTMALLRHQAEVARVTVKESYDENLPLVSLDANQIKQVFLNIITNAIQAMPQGGELEVVTSYRPRAIDGTDCVAVEFRDTGTGISAENLPRIFDPFFTTKKAGQGTGLGLSISHGIVEKHGGKIEVESEMGQGSTFTVLLPVAEGRRES